MPFIGYTVHIRIYTGVYSSLPIHGTNNWFEIWKCLYSLPTLLVDKWHYTSIYWKNNEVEEEWYWEYLPSTITLGPETINFTLLPGVWTAACCDKLRSQRHADAISARSIQRLEGTYHNWTYHKYSCHRFSGSRARILRILIILLRLQLGSCSHIKELSCSMVTTIASSRTTEFRANCCKTFPQALYRTSYGGYRGTTKCTWLLLFCSL